MWKDKEETAEKLLENNTLLIDGRIDASTADYIFQSMLYLETIGSPDIKIYISSPGGEGDNGLTVYDMIRVYKGKKTAIVVGAASSMAAIILQAADVRKALRYSTILIHYIHFNERLSFDEEKNGIKIRRALAILEKSQKKIYNIISKKTKRSKKEIARQFRKDQSMTAKEALNFGLIDEII